jgi:2-oxoglutarate ferredoxin oxidoreductase subunit alpha
MRGGPGLGNISPAQGDYYQATRGGGNGDYRLIVFAPNSVQEMADDVMDAFYLADKYRMPAMVMADGMLGQMMEPVEFKEPKSRKDLPAKDWALTGAKGRPRNIVRSLMLGGTGLYEHNEVLRKIYAQVEAAEARHEELETADAEVTLVAYGSASRACIGAVRHLRAAGKKVGLIRPRVIWPYPYKALEKQAEKSKKFLVVEMNLGQMVDDVRIGVAGKAPVEFYGYAGGWIPTVKEVVDRVNQML